MRYVFIPALVLVYLIVGAPSWMTSLPGLAAALVYPLFHANIWHLAVNCLSLWVVFPPGRKGAGREMALSWAISTLVWFIAPRPVVGVSNLLYAVIGLRTPPLRSRWWRRPEVLVFLGVTVVMLPFPQVAGLTHIAAFVTGMLVAMATRKIRRTLYDCRRTERM